MRAELTSKYSHYSQYLLEVYFHYIIIQLNGIVFLFGMKLWILVESHCI